MNKKGNAVIGVVVALGVVFLVLIMMFGFPIYRVWQQGLVGKAALERAQQERQVLIAQALAEREAATERAKAIEIIGEMAKKYPEYRLQEFLGAFAEALQNGSIEKIIFVPTEANIPIVEAGRTGNEK